MSSKEGTLSICGPCRDGQFTVWYVRGPKGGTLGEFVTREAARAFVKARKRNKRKELTNAR